MAPRHLTALLALFLNAACSGSTAPPAGPAAPSESATPAAPGATGTAAAAPPPAKRPDPTTADDCKAMATDPTADAAPEEGGAAGPAGNSDWFGPMMEVMRKKRPAFRCCFDVWAGKLPEVKLYTKVAFAMKLDPSGKLKDATAKSEEGGPAVSSEVGSCLSEVAGALTYPPSSSGKETTYTHHFDFKPKKRK